MGKKKHSEDAKRLLIETLFIWLVVVTCFVFLLSLSGCATRKITAKSSNVKSTTQTTASKKDSTKVTTINKEIKDKIVLSLRTNNKLVDSIIKERLKGFTTSKKSGSNRYRANFDYEKMALNIASVIGATKDVKETKNKEVSEQKTFEKKTDTYIYKKIKQLPFWVWGLIALWLLPQIANKFNLIRKLLKI